MRRLMFIVLILLLVCGSIYYLTSGSSQPTYESVKAVAPGNPAPDFQLEDNQGNLVSLSALRGKVIIGGVLRIYALRRRGVIPVAQTARPELGSSYTDNTNRLRHSHNPPDRVQSMNAHIAERSAAFLYEPQVPRGYAASSDASGASVI